MTNHKYMKKNNEKLNIDTSIIDNQIVEKNSIKRQKTRKLRLSIKLLIPVVFTVTILSFILCFVSYGELKKNLINDAISTTRILADIGTSLINGDHLYYIVKESDTEKVIYKQLANRLEIINSGNALKYIYTIYFRNGKAYYGVDIDENKKNKFLPGDEYSYTSTQAEYKALKKGEIYSDKEICTYDGELLITSVAPIYDSHGELVGAIGCDYDGEKY